MADGVMESRGMFPDAEQLARFLARTRRKLSACRAGNGVGSPGAEVGIRDLGPGFVTWKVVDDGAATPTASSDRVFWLAPERAITGEDVREAVEFYRGLGRGRAFFVVAPWAWSDALGEEMLRAGMRPWPYVRYPVLVRETAERANERWRETPLDIRVVGNAGAGGNEIDRVLEAIAPWYGREWLPLVRRVVTEANAELHVAFDGEGADARPVAIGGIVIDGEWAYVCFGATEEASRGRGAQTALFRSRLASARARGVRWCVGETNTVAEQSLRNFLRCGFVEACEMVVWGWEDA